MERAIALLLGSVTLGDLLHHERAEHGRRGLELGQGDALALAGPVSVIEGAPSKKVCSGTSCCAAAAEGGAFTFGPFSLIFFGLFFDGCGL